MRGPIRLRNPQDLFAGLFLIAVAILAHYLASDLSMGRLVRMGPGYLPTALSWLLGGLGLIVALRGFTIDGPQLASWAWQPLIALSLSLIAFALLLERGGLIIAIIVTTLIASLATPHHRPLTTLTLGVALSAMSAALFIGLLGLPLRLWPDLG